MSFLLAILAHFPPDEQKNFPKEKCKMIKYKNVALLKYLPSPITLPVKYEQKVSGVYWQLVLHIFSRKIVRRNAQKKVEKNEKEHLSQ